MVLKKQPELLGVEEFSQRFVERMVRHPDALSLRDGSSVRLYAERVAHAYWIEAHETNASPEDFADADMGHWGK